MRAEYVKIWLAVARRAEKYGSTSGGKERAAATETGDPEDTATQEGVDNWMRFVDLVQTELR